MVVMKKILQVLIEFYYGKIGGWQIRPERLQRWRFYYLSALIILGIGFIALFLYLWSFVVAFLNYVFWG